MDKETAQKVRKQLEKTAEKEEIRLNKIILFGSRSRNDYTENSDVDLIIISEDFKGTKWFKRGGEFQRQWDYDNLPTPEIICLTPQELKKRKQKKADIASIAAEEGVEI